MTYVHLDADFLVKAVSAPGAERRQLLDLASSETPIGMSAVAWYEFTRGPRTPEQLALASMVIEEDDVVAFDAVLAQRSAETFRRLRSPRRRANDIAIGTTAAAHSAMLWTLNPSDFVDVPDLELGPA